MADGETGLNGGRARGRVVLVFPCKRGNVITQRRFTEAPFASERGPDIKLVISIHVLKASRAFGLNNVQEETTNSLREKNMFGSRSSTPTIPASYIVLTKTIH